MAIKTLHEGTGGPGPMKEKLLDILLAKAQHSSTFIAVKNYLDTVRCENCQHWSRTSAVWMWGECAWLSESGSQQAYCDAVVSTAPDFFCAKFEER